MTAGPTNVPYGSDLNLARRSVAPVLEERNCVIVVRGPDKEEAPLTDVGKRMYERLPVDHLRPRSVTLAKIEMTAK
jgi:hypothetical protein